MTENTITYRTIRFTIFEGNIYTEQEYNQMLINKYGDSMDKKMRKVTKKIRSAESTLKKAEKENEKLADFDEKVRDPIIKKCDKEKKKKK
jgi:hypothetical protein